MWNNINFKKGNIVSSPSWTLYGNDISVFNPLAITDPGYIANADATKFKPENFIEQDALSALLVDTSANKRLRKIFTPGDSQFGTVFDNGRSAKTSGATSSKRVRTLTSFYSAGSGEFDTNKIDLTDVFGEDRFKVIQDIRDSKAIFIVGDQSNDDTPYIGTFQASVNTSEI